jgi:hypothetical protein
MRLQTTVRHDFILFQSNLDHIVLDHYTIYIHIAVVFMLLIGLILNKRLPSAFNHKLYAFKFDFVLLATVVEL